MNFIKNVFHVSNRPSLRSVFWNVKLSRVSCVSFIKKKKRFEERFVLQNQIKKNSTHH